MARSFRAERILRLAGCFLACLMLFGVTASKQAQAARFSGEYLLKVCMMDAGGNEVIKGGKIACQAYISGVIDYHNMMRSFEGSAEMKKMDFCIPEDVTLNEIHLRVLKYLIEHNKMHRKFVAAPGVALALFSAYPCK